MGWEQELSGENKAGLSQLNLPLEAIRSRDSSPPSCLNVGKSCFEYESGGGNGTL